jgi:hypothetical protein
VQVNGFPRRSLIEKETRLLTDGDVLLALTVRLLKLEFVVLFYDGLELFLTFRLVSFCN